jgi:transcriptional regulator with XRE-family HTH domain
MGVLPEEGSMNDRAQILKDWITQEGRKQTWVAQQVGCSPQWLSYVLRGKKPMSEKLADALQQKLGVPLEARRPVQNGTKRKGGVKKQTQAKA